MADTKITPEIFNNLKARVKAEMNRRNGSGSLTSYAGAAYDYSAVPGANAQVKLEYVDKNLEPLRAVNPSGLPNIGEKKFLEADRIAMESATSLFESKPKASNTSDCAGGCTGLCYGCSGTCQGGCSGCSGCGDSCSNDCWDECYGYCQFNCSGSCDNTCDGCWGCTDNCTSSCGSACSSDCEVYCGYDCWNTCAGNCTDNGCYFDCWNQVALDAQNT